MFLRAHASTPSFSSSSVECAALAPMRSHFGGGVPTTVSVCTLSGQRAAKWRAIVPPSLAAIRWNRSMPSCFMSAR